MATDTWTSSFIAPSVEGVYPVRTATLIERFSYFDGNYWRGIWPSASEAWRMKIAPVIGDISQWRDHFCKREKENNYGQYKQA